MAKIKVSKNHHDSYFKEIFSKKHQVTDLLQGVLPELAKNINLASLKIDNNSYINKELDSEYTDLVYNCFYGKEKIKIALIFEHKSKKETFIELQLLHYIISVWLYNIKQKEELVPVIPIVFHHGKDKPVLNAFDRFNKLPDELKKYLPTFECELIDTTNLSNDDILNIFTTANLKFSMVVMKYIQNSPERVFAELQNLKKVINTLLNNKEGEELIYTTSIYLSKIPNTDMETIVNKFSEIEQKAGKIAKSAWEKEFEKGIEKGIEKNTIKNAMKMLKLNFEFVLIQDITGLSLERIEELKDKLDSQNNKK